MLSGSLVVSFDVQKLCALAEKKPVPAPLIAYLPCASARKSCWFGAVPVTPN